LTYVPDEEIGGADGMEAFVKTEVFKKLNIGFVIDESEPSTREKEFVILYGERANWGLFL
jgi:aminoacylase